MGHVYKLAFSIHSGATKMYKDLRHDYSWSFMKIDVPWYIEMCLICRQVKAEHQRPHGKLQPLYIPLWKKNIEFWSISCSFSFYFGMKNVWIDLEVENMFQWRWKLNTYDSKSKEVRKNIHFFLWVLRFILMFVFLLFITIIWAFMINLFKLTVCLFYLCYNNLSLYGLFLWINFSL